MVEVASNKVKSCFYCGYNGLDVSSDHIIPRCILRFPRGVIGVKKHPLRDTVWSRYNKIPLCLEHHKGVDREKMDALGYPFFSPLNPAGLIEYLRDQYTLSEIPEFRGHHLDCLILTQKSFARAAVGIDGNFFSKDLIDRYRVASQIAHDFALELERKKLQMQIDLRQEQMVESFHQTSTTKMFS